MAKPDFSKMTRRELKSYVIAHRDDDEAIEILIKTFKPSGSLRSSDEVEAAFAEMLERRAEGDAA